MSDNPLCADAVPEMGEASIHMPPPIDVPPELRNVIDPKLVDPFSIHRQSVVFPGIDGIPFKGPPPNLKDTDPEHNQPQLAQQAKVKQLNLAEPKDMEQYQQIIQIIANGYGQISFEDRVYDESIKSWRVLIRWIEYFYHLPRVTGEGFGR